MTIVLFMLFILFSTLTDANTNTNNIPQFSQTLNPKTLNPNPNNQKLSHLHFYVHDSVNGKNPTTVRVAKSATSDTSPTAFGVVSVMDDPLTLLPNRDSKRVGTTQGIYVWASQTEIGFLMVCNFVFTEGKYNGSSLSVLGRNAIFHAMREMPIVGGSGIFRFARGFAQAKTYTFNTTSFDAVIEYNVYVFHY